MSQIEELRKAAKDAFEKLQAAEDVERKKQDAKLVGRCFKYHNSGGGCDERWWLYYRIVGLNEYRLDALSFEVLPNGNISIEPNTSVPGGRFANGSGYTEISRAEFDEAWDALLSAVDHCPA
jgi:hypothetical protein